MPLRAVITALRRCPTLCATALPLEQEGPGEASGGPLGSRRGQNWWHLRSSTQNGLVHLLVLISELL